MINDLNENEIVLLQAPKGSAEIQNLMVDSFKNNKDKIFVVLFLTLYGMNNYFFFKAGDAIRTRDINLGKVALYP